MMIEGPVVPHWILIATTAALKTLVHTADCRKELRGNEKGPFSKFSKDNLKRQTQCYYTGLQMYIAAPKVK
jgi:hypothetical protein